MITNPFKRQPVNVWVIKQIDERILHLCGKGALESKQKRSRLLEDLANNRYDGGVRMDDTGVILNSRRLEALVPLDELELDKDIAHWQGKTWLVSHVPQRCWNFDGRLVAKPDGTIEQPRLVSSEDVSTIRDRVNRSEASPGDVKFRPVNATEDPQKNVDAEIKEAQDRRKKSSNVWRKDGSWGSKDETPENK